MTIQELSEEIAGISPRFPNVLGNGVPGMGGTAVTTLGAANSASDKVLELQRAMADFVHQYASPNVGRSELLTRTKKVEGPLLALQTLSVISKDKVDHLLNELFELVERR